MPGTLLHSPADVIRRLLIDLGLGLDPSPTTAEVTWPVYATTEPSVPDNCITVYDTTGYDEGRTAPDSERQEHHGFQVRIRSATFATGYVKARAIATAMDAQYQDVMTLDGSRYLVHCITRIGDVLPIGKETPNSKRDIFTINCKAALRKL